MSQTIKNIIIISDLHCGCQMGLMRPDGAHLDGGGHVEPSDLQKKVWEIWLYFWNKQVPRWVKGEEYDVVVNGDVIDGSHHGSTSQWSHNLADQTAAAFDILEPIFKKAHRAYMIRGTEAHVGQSGTDEERLAKALGAVKSEHGNHARWELWKHVGNYLCHFTHHIGFTSSATHETSAVNAELALMFTEAGRWGHKPPAIICRSHRHSCSEIRLPSRDFYATAFCTAAWQLKTPFTYRIARGRTGTPQIGGSLIRLGDEELHTRHFVRDIARDDAE